MNLQNRVKEYLISEPKFRERAGRENGTVNLLIERYPDLANVSKRTLIDAIHDSDSILRYWRLLLAMDENKDLRGTDFSDGKALAQQKQLDLGFEPHYHQDIKSFPQC